MNIRKLINGDELIILLNINVRLEQLKIMRLVILIVRLLIGQNSNIYVVDNYYVLLNHVQIRYHKLIT